MKNSPALTVLRTGLTLILVIGLLLACTKAEAIPNQGGMTIPKTPDKQAMARGEEAALDYVDNYGDLSITVIAAGIDRRGVVAAQQPGLIDAINTEIQSQFRKYTAGEIDIIQPSFGAKQVGRILARQNAGEKPDDVILQEMVEMSSAPYVLFFAVGPDTTGVKEAGVVTIRFIEVATGRVLFTVSDQFWQDRKRFPNVPTAAWVQHSVTYWMNEVMDELNFPKAFKRFRAPLEFVGDMPEDNLWLREAIAGASGIDKNKINPRSIVVGGIDKVTVTLRLDAPPHTVIDEMTQKLQKQFEKKGVALQSLRQDGGSVIYAVSNTPLWWALTNNKDDTFRQSFIKAYAADGKPSIAVLTDISQVVASTPLGGDAVATAAGVEKLLIELGASVTGVGTAKLSFADSAAQGQEGAFERMLPPNLKQRAQWVMLLEIVPTANRDAPAMMLARLVDLQQDRVIGSAVFPANAAAIPPGEAKLDVTTHASRYLTGSIVANVIAKPRDTKTLDVIVINAPSFEFVNRVDNIVRAREGVTETVLPSWDAKATKYSFEARYTGDTKPMVERLRADLAGLPLTIQSFDSGQITLVYAAPAEAP